MLAIDSDPTLVQKYSDDLTHTAVADITDPDALRHLDVPSFERAMVGINIDELPPAQRYATRGW